jgi:hypothetical protein
MSVQVAQHLESYLIIYVCFGHRFCFSLLCLDIEESTIFMSNVLAGLVMTICSQNI